MKLTKKLLVIHLNEFNYDYLKYGSKKYNYKYLNKLIRLSRIYTFTKDKIQNKNLDPWVQSVSINSGKMSKDHKIFKLGQKIPRSLINIWDVLTTKKITCSVWGPMNSQFKKSQYMKLFFPDPWNFRVNPYPQNLKSLHLLPKYYAKNYLDLDVKKIINYSLYFLYGLFKNNVIFFFLKNFNLIIKSLLLAGLKNFILFFLFDLISLSIFEKNLKLSNRHFSFIFLNSLAHFQHNNWNDKKNEIFYFAYVDRVAQYIFSLYNYHDSLMIFNGFKQKQIKEEYLIRPINPKNFLKKIIHFDKLEQDMTNGGFIFFKNSKDTNQAFKLMKDYSMCGLSIFEINQKTKYSFFYRINIKANKNLKIENINKLTNQKLINFFKYENKKKIKTKRIKSNMHEFKNFLKDILLIKTTGIHDHKGDILFDNFKLDKKVKKIENHKIFNIIKEYFI